MIHPVTRFLIPLLHTSPAYSGIFFDSFEGSAGNQTRCLDRAVDYLAWCGSSSDDPRGALARMSHVTALYVGTGLGFADQQPRPSSFRPAHSLGTA